MRTAFFALVAVATTLSTLLPLNAKSVPESRHTLEFGEGVYNIQLIDIGDLLVAETGDPRSEGELHSVRIELMTRMDHPVPDQFDRRTYYTPPGLWKRGYANRNLTYLPINRGDWVSVGNNRAPVQGPDNLWVHSIPRDRDNKLEVRITISARELDCTRDRVCRRGNSSSTSLYFLIPAPGPVPYTCQSSNTWDILPIDGETSLAMPGVYNGGGNGNNSWGLRMFESEGPNLHLQNAKLCITRSTREPWSAAQKLREQADRAERMPRSSRSIVSGLRP